MTFELTDDKVRNASDDFMGRWFVESMISPHHVTTLIAIKEQNPRIFYRAMRDALIGFMKDPAVVKYLGDPKTELVLPEKVGRDFLTTLMAALAHREPVAPNAVYESLRWAKHRIEHLERVVEAIGYEAKFELESETLNGHD